MAKECACGARNQRLGGFGPGRGVEKETPGKFAKTSPQKVGRKNPVCRQSHPPIQAGCFNLAIVAIVAIVGTGKRPPYSTHSAALRHRQLDLGRGTRRP